ncbi:replication factor A protein 2 [Entophlyctis luteolus]|nr:replication factor A protein 2 [Entophlyctis luteolus]KAJ3357000.1 replication factor A protein 2 [Entophlyctis luteolus]KAJ3394298.1 replication factor A protein 2 [Entophlyctis sp. JEL0112]
MGAGGNWNNNNRYGSGGGYGGYGGGGGSVGGGVSANTNFANYGGNNNNAFDSNNNTSPARGYSGGGGFSDSQSPAPKTVSDTAASGKPNHSLLFVQKFANQTLRPVSIKHLLRARAEIEGNPPVLDGIELGLVRIVGRITKTSVTSTALKYVLAEGPHTIECSKLMGSDMSDSAELNAFSEGTFVKVFGAAKIYKSQVQVANMFVYPITNFDEVTYHSLECVYVHLKLTRGEEMTNPMTVDQSNALNSSVYAVSSSNGLANKYSQYPRVQASILSILDKYTDAVPKSVLIAQMRGIAPPSEIEMAFNALESEGFIYDNGDQSFQKTN